jgi:uncharacterized protein YcgI (DUF1989 family)
VIVPARRGKAFRLSGGESIKVVNTHGSQVVDAWALAPPDLREHMSMPHTRATLESLRVRVGDHLYSERRRPILTLVEDTSSGVHDMLFPACDPARYELLGHEGHHDNCRENFHAALAELGVGRPAVPSPLNLFMNVSFEGGELELLPSVSGPGDHVVLRAERDVVVVLSGCPQDMVPINGPAMVPHDVGVELLSTESTGGH